MTPAKEELGSYLSVENSRGRYGDIQEKVIRVPETMYVTYSSPTQYNKQNGIF